MTEAERGKAATQFAADWQSHGDEKQETQSFWISLLQDVFGVEEPTKYIQFELPVKLSHTSFIDGYIPATRVLIEQKGKEISTCEKAIGSRTGVCLRCTSRPAAT